jgi:hypothetical protein
MKLFPMLGLTVAFFTLSAGAFGDEAQEVEKLNKILTTSKDKSAKLSALSDLGLIASVNGRAVVPALPAMVSAFKGEKDPGLRAAAAYALCHVSGADNKQIVAVCITILNDDKEDGTLRAATANLVHQLAYYGRKETLDALPALNKAKQDEMKKKVTDQNERLLENLTKAIAHVQVLKS